MYVQAEVTASVAELSKFSVFPFQGMHQIKLFKTPNPCPNTSMSWVQNHTLLSCSAQFVSLCCVYSHYSCHRTAQLTLIVQRRRQTGKLRTCTHFSHSQPIKLKIWEIKVNLLYFNVLILAGLAVYPWWSTDSFFQKVWNIYIYFKGFLDKTKFPTNNSSSMIKFNFSWNIFVPNCLWSKPILSGSMLRVFPLL